MAGTTISGSHTTGIALSDTASNPVLVTGTIDVASGVALGASAASAWSVTNQGSIHSGNSTAVSIVSGTTLTNATGGIISGYSGIYVGNARGTVTNLGDIAALGANGAGIQLSRGGSVINQSGGTISGHRAVPLASPVGGTLLNSGSIIGIGAGSYGGNVYNGVLTNQTGGVIAGDSAGYGVELNFSTMVNHGTISGGFAVSATATDLLINDGIIAGGTAGITLKGGGSVTNNAGGTITGGHGGYAIEGAGAVTTAGSIGGPGGAISFMPNYNNLLIINPGAGFGGNVNGGTHGAQNFNTILLASGASAGTLTGIGSQFINFDRVNVTIDATWTLNATLGSGYSISNSGTLINTGSLGIDIEMSEALTNASGATITAAGQAVHGFGTVVNAGHIAGTDGVYLFLSVNNSVTNLAGGVIAGSRNGVYLSGTADLVNAGIITGTKHAVQFGAGHSDTLTIDPGAIFSGTVDGGNVVGAAYVTTLLLASGASIGTIADIGSKYVNFGSIGIDAAATWDLAGQDTLVAGTTLTNQGALNVLAGITFADAGSVVNDGIIALDPSTMQVADLSGSGRITVGTGGTLDAQGAVASGQTIQFGAAGATLHLEAPSSMAGSVTQFGTGETIDLAGVDPASISFSGGQLNFAGGSFAMSLAAASGVQAHASDDGAAVAVICFCADTSIATPRGPVAVQDLAVGDAVLTLSGKPRHIVWIGAGKVLAPGGRRGASTPVIVRKGALADNVPDRDLYVTKGHSLYIDQVLIPVEYLVNHHSIVWDDRAQEVTVYHIELETHDVLLANGAPAESYRDDGNRWLFQNVNAGWHQAPRPSCAPVLTGGPTVDAIWRRLLDRVVSRPNRLLTSNPNLHLLVDGKRIDAFDRSDARYVFQLTAQPRAVRIRSRVAAPLDLGLARDPRPLGVAIRRLVLAQPRSQRAIEADAASLVDGYHAFEPGIGIRWTTGNARVPRELFARMHGAGMLTVQLGSSTQYLHDGAATMAA